MAPDYCSLTSGRGTLQVTLILLSKPNVQRKMGDRTNFSVTVVARLRRPHILQSPVGGKICGSFARITWLEEVCHWGQDLRFRNLMPFPAELSLLPV